MGLRSQNSDVGWGVTLCNLQLHFWLEKTAFFKMPKGQEQELTGSKHSSLEKARLSH